MTVLNTDNIDVLFIDDEQFVLDGISRLIRVRYPKWNAVYINDPICAIKQFKVGSKIFDIVVCDINMPIVSGLNSTWLNG